MEIYEQVYDTFIFKVMHISFGERLFVVKDLNERRAEERIGREFGKIYPNMNIKLVYDSTNCELCEILEV